MHPAVKKLTLIIPKFIEVSDRRTTLENPGPYNYCIPKADLGITRMSASLLRNLMGYCKLKCLHNVTYDEQLGDLSFSLDVNRVSRNL